MRGKKAKALRRMARDEFLDRVAKSKPITNDKGESVHQGLLRGLYHKPNETRVAVNHPESLRGMEHIAKRVYKRHAAKDRQL